MNVDRSLLDAVLAGVNSTAESVDHWSGRLDSLSFVKSIWILIFSLSFVFLSELTPVLRLV